MEHVHKINPFSKRETYDNRSLVAYKILTVFSWLLVLVTSVVYLFNAPNDGHSHHHHYHTIWGQNSHHHSPFHLNSVVTTLYWIALLVFQAVYLWHLYSGNTDWVNVAANVGSHFIFNNLLHFGFLMCWVRGHFWPAELLLIINLLNLTSLYFRHSTSPRLVHVGAVSGPLSWTYVAIFWNGAAAVGAHNLPARIVANVFIWSILIFGVFFLTVFKDYTIGFELTILTLALALGQFTTKIFALQWIFAFVIMGVLFVLTLAVAVPGLFGKEFSIRREGDVVSSDRERQPLLQDE